MLRPVTTTSARTLTLLSLLGTGRTYSGRELRERLEVSERTLRRDVDTLRALGYAVEPVKGVHGGYRLGPGGAIAPIVFDEDQAVATVVALQIATATLVGIEESARRARDTVSRALPRRLQHTADAFTVTVVPNQWEFLAEPIDADLVEQVGRAVRQNQMLRLEHGEEQLRVEPHHLVVWAARWYLVAHDGHQWRVLRLDRIRLHAPTNARFEPRPLPEDPVDLVRRTPDRGDRPAPWPCLGSADLALPAPTVAEFAPGGAVVEAVSPTICRLTMGAWSWIGLAGLYLTFGARLSRVEPAPLRDAFAEARALTP
jgi:predicted DNA-binding transcriptional regulator YafY